MSLNFVENKCHLIFRQIVLDALKTLVSEAKQNAGKDKTRSTKGGKG